MTGRSDARTTLEALERSNLFVVPLDDRRQWYRYHHLFGDVLRARLADEEPDRVVALHRRASDWFDADGDRAEAIRHAMAAEDFTKAAELVELTIADLRQARQEATLRAWLDVLPRDMFANGPVLTLALVGSHMATGDIAGVEELLDDIERWIDPDRPTYDMVVHDHAEFRRLPTQVAMYRAGLALLRGDLAGTVAQGERAARLSAPDDHFGQGPPPPWSCSPTAPTVTSRPPSVSTRRQSPRSSGPSSSPTSSPAPSGWPTSRSLKDA